MWYYVPIAIRLIQDTKDDIETSPVKYSCLSGVHFIKRQSGKITKSYVVTISHNLKILEGSIAVNSKHLNSEDVVKWYKCKLISDVPVSKASDSMFKFLDSFKQQQFSFLPSDLEGGKLSDMRVLIASPDNPSLHNLVGLKQYEPFNMCRCATGDLISIRSYPFNKTNSILFGDFVSRGYISYTFQERRHPAVYLTDIRYLDNMVGGVVGCGEGTAGLILGNLRKFKGHGDLMVIVAWERLWKLFINEISEIVTQPVKHRRQASVLPIVLSGKSSQTWGSCVYYNESTLITNFHVIKEFIEDAKETKCYIYISPDESILLNSNDIIFTPYKSLDVSFIELDEGKLLRLKENRVPIEYKKIYETGDVVKTMSFGLFLNKSSMSPLESKGVLSSKFSLPFHENSNSKTPCMLVTSASCWNGSSGGGLFDPSNKFIGLICSNAQVQVPSLDSSVKELETVPDFSMCLPIDIIEECYKVMKEETPSPINPRIEKLWGLNAYHRDTIIRERKL